jgi:SAM-dependent methyltransferase
MTVTDAGQHDDPGSSTGDGDAGSASDLATRLFEAAIGTLELFGIHLGVRLGLFDALDKNGTLTEDGLAERAGVHPRYAREWLEQQAVAGILAVDDVGAAPADRRYSLPAEHRGVLVDPVDAEHLAPFAGMVVGIAQALDDVVDAYKTGAGVPYRRYGSHFRQGQGGINRPAFSSDLVESWLPATAGVTEKLAGGGRVVDLGTGHGWSAIAVKKAWPQADVIGVDNDEASVTEARAIAAAAGVEARFEQADASELSDLGDIDVVLIMEALHDMSRPAEVLASVRQALAPGGIVVIADEAVAPSFTAPGDELERMMYGWSITHCLPVAMAEQPSAAIGTVIRHGTVDALAREAGFSGAEIVDVDAGFFRIYRLQA